MSLARKSIVACTALGLLGCDGFDEPVSELQQPFASPLATLVEFEFRAEAVVGRPQTARRDIDNQLLYTIGQLNGANSVGRLDRLAVDELTTEPLDDGRVLARYRARLPVAWGSAGALPSEYALVVPRVSERSSLEQFTARYQGSCVQWNAHDVTRHNMWYHFRPSATGCRLAEEDVVRSTATVSRSVENTEGKYPEYDKIWEDGQLQVVAIFGKNEDGATSGSDDGIAAYNQFIALGKNRLPGAVTTPAELPPVPGVAHPAIRFEAALEADRRIQVDALLVDSIRDTDASFDRRYEELTRRADLVMYHGHSGLGVNIRALASKGDFVRGQYQIFFLNGCDSFAYVDGALFEAHRRVNPDDPTGSQYLDLVLNAMPSYFNSNARNAWVLVDGLRNPDAPLSYVALLQSVDAAQVVLTIGEEDNRYDP